jgi:outer membrane protein assembly factor BamB
MGHAMNLRQTIHKIFAVALLGASCALQSGAALPLTHDARAEAPTAESRGAPRPASQGASERAAAPATGLHAAGLIPSPEPGWPQWRGKFRDGISDDKGLLQSWPEGGPKLLWKATGLGKGWSSPIIVGDTLYITGDVGEDLVIFALDLGGKPKWQAKNGASWQKSYPGARAACAYSEGRLYNMSAHGRTACLEAATGKELWAVNVLEAFEGKNITWAIAECLLVDGPRVIVTPGGRKAMMAALDKTTGKTVWASDPIPGERAGYGSPILFEYGGRRHLVNFSSRHGFGADADTGKLQWTADCVNRYEVNICTPIYSGGQVLLVAPDGPNAQLLRLDVQGERVRAERAWTNDLDTCNGGGVLVDGMVYGAGYRSFRGWRCLDFRSGQTRYEMHDLDSGSALWADGRLYALAESGAMALLKPAAGGFETCGRFDLVPPTPRKHDVWPHPVLLDGRLYLRYHDTLWCYDVRAK